MIFNLIKNKNSKKTQNENEDLRMYEIKSKYKIQNLEKELHDRKTND